MKKPIIGIIPGYNYQNSTTTVPKDYLDAVDAASGLPVIISNLTSPEYHNEVADLCNGILITGSLSDVDPQKYNQQPIPQCGEVNPLREEVDWILLDIIFRKKIPLFGICHGHQEINVYLGGTLYQDIETQVPNAVKHRQSPPFYYPVHKITIEQNKLLHKITGKRTLNVNSRHHQGINKLAKGLVPLALSDDKLVEAFILDSKKHFVLGIQWHPENMYKNDKASLHLFQYFTTLCKNKKNH
ncbi:MAG: hypothetical protein A2Y62_07225 [Candidatus Fischerbacteria bacterium RBG_13_37_8]|uniref:Uncharacterized protein n=1 Tax=Candidatus Fischerbacteria bacterium RBG_13_37_8 TaxID=1817863 RepID=A0A1F5VJ38_9BACT|nr:MAG: hypothetical protein A2Y62_07225 [Candidatus Fischerbacteria bacterium RBG_13_37_8]